MRRKGGALPVICWAHMPRSASELFAILKTTRDDELVLLMTRVGGSSGRIAWAEFGQRKYGIAYGIASYSAQTIVLQKGVDN